MNRHFSKEDTQMDNKHMKRCSATLITKDIQLKTAIRYHLIPSKMVIKTKANTKQEWMRIRTNWNLDPLLGRM